MVGASVWRLPTRTPYSALVSHPAPRVLIVGFHTPLNQAAVLGALDESAAQGAAPEFVALVSRSNFLGDRADVYIDSSDGYRTRGFTESKDWPFPSRQLWTDLRPAESTAYRMMDRVHRVSRAGRGIDSRKRRWLEWVAFAHGFLRHHRIDRVVQCNVPHFPFEFVLHETARAMGIETRFLMQLQVKDTYLTSRSIEELYDPLNRAIEGMGDAAVTLEPRMETELARRTTRHQPFYMHSKGVPLWTRFYTFQRRFLRGRFRSIPAARAYRAARRARGTVPSHETPYVYLPLHLQPEATTLPLGGVHVDQLLAVESLIRTLPDGWLVVVKENPKQRFEKRDASFYRRLAQIDRVRLVGRDVNSFDLMQGSRAVATITGSAGWEALCSGKPTLTFGNAFYRNAPGSVAVEGLDSLRNALDAIDSGAFEAPTVEGCSRFLAALQSVTHTGVSDALYLRDSEYDLEAAARSCTGAVAEAMGLAGTYADGPTTERSVEAAEEART